jgi:uncharacterized protein
VNLKDLLTALAEVLVMLPAGVLVAVMLHRRGFLDRDVFRHAPPRDLGLGVPDLLAALCLFALGSVVLAGAMTALKWPAQPTAATHPATSQPATAPAETTANATTQPLPRPASALRREATLALLGQGLTQLPMVLWVLVRAGRQPEGLRKLGVVPRHPLRDVRAAAVGLMAALPMVWGVTVLAAALGTLFGQKPPDIGHELLRAMRESLMVSPVILGALVVSAALLAPVLEELIFRGFVQTSLLNTAGTGRHWTAVLGAGAAFALVHAGATVAWQSLPALFILGIVLGWLYERTGSLWPGILLHMGFNGLNIALVLVTR